MSHPSETFDQFYARISANRKAEIAACTDPVKRAEHEAWDKHFEGTYRTAWQIERARRARLQSVVSEGEQDERRGQHYADNGRDERPETGYDNNSTYIVDRKGKAW